MTRAMIVVALVACLLAVGCKGSKNPSGPTWSDRVTTPDGVYGDPTWTKVPQAWGGLPIGQGEE